MSTQIISGATSDMMTVDATSKAARTTLYDNTGAVLTKLDRATITPGAQSTIPTSGADYKNNRILRVSHSGAIRVDDDQLLFTDNCEGAAYDSNKWIQTLASFTVVQTAANGMQFNAGSSVTTTQGAMHLSHRFFPLPARSGLVFSCKARHGAHSTNNIIEMGFGSPTSATATSTVNGACWRKDGSGQYVPVITINTGSDILGTPVSNATFLAAVPNTDYATFEVQLFDDHAHFVIYSQSGVLVTSQDLDFSGTSTPHFSQTHLQAMLREYNSGTVATAVQAWFQRISVYAIDSINGRSFREMMSGIGYNSLTSPTAYTQLSNFANSTVPSAATLSNTAAGYTTLGGQFSFTTVAGAETDYALFAIQIPTPLTFFFTGIRISSWVSTASATTPTVLQWGLGFNSSAVSLATAAPYSPMKLAIGTQVFATAAVQGTIASDVAYTPGTPLVCQANRFFHVILKTPVSTAAGVIRGTIAIDGWFE